MATFSFDDLNSNPATDTLDGLRNIANTAANAACNLYSNYPRGIIPNLGDPTGFGQIASGLMSKLCSPRGPTPPPPLPPMTGGQCPKRYTVNVTFSAQGIPEQTANLVNVLGPIAGTTTSPQGVNAIGFGVQGAPDPPSRPDGYAGALTIPQSIVDSGRIRINSVTPVSGPDNCGNPAPAYPTVVAPNNVFNTNTTVNVGGGVSLAVPVAIVPVLFKANATFSPQLRVDVGGVKVTFDAGGVTLSPTINFGKDTPSIPPGFNPTNPTPTPKPPLPPERQDCDSDEIVIDLSEILTKLNALKDVTDDIKECSCPGKYELVSTALGNGNSGAVPLPANTRFVRFSVGTLDANVQNQWGGTGAPNVYYVGWCSFSDGPFAGGDRTQLQYQITTLPVPPWATAVNWTIKGGMTASVSAISAVPEDSSYEPAIAQFKKKAI